MKGKPLISVIVPVYNAEAYLEKCINSILEQTYDSMQIILVDDGSIDRSGAICDEFSLADERVEVIHTSNGGPVRARKCGISRALGKYIGFVDADDYVESDLYEVLVNSIIDADADFVNVGFWEEQIGKQICVNDFPEGIFEFKSEDDRAEFLDRYVLNTEKGQFVSNNLWTKLFKKELIENVFLSLPEEVTYGEDMLCLCGCILRSNKVVLHREAFYHYTVRTESLSHLDRESYILNEVKLMAGLIDELQSENFLGKMKEQIANHVLKRMMKVLKTTSVVKDYVPRYYVGDMQQFAGKRVLIYGAGAVGRDYYLQFKRYGKCQVVAWVDSKFQNYQYDYAQVTAFESVEKEYDVAVVAVKDEKISNTIKKDLMAAGVSAEKINWVEPREYW